MVRTLRALVSSIGLASALVLTGMPAAHADDYAFLKAQDLQQTVLRAQMPRALGPWTQYFYFTETGRNYTVPTMCWDRNGNVTLPKAKVVGAVGYQVSQSTGGSVMIYQYATAQAAQAALTAMHEARCSDSPRVPDEGGQLVQAESGSDFTDSSMRGYAAGVNYVDGGVQMFRDVRTTQRGLAIVQTEITRTVQGTPSVAQGEQVANQLGSVNKSWHANVVRAYESFGQGRAS